MDIIPVIDLRGGQVVHARKGDRDAYRPLRSALSASSAPLPVVAGLMRLAPFRRLYVADLDAIAGRAGDAGLWAALADAWPMLELWIDAGFDGAAAAGALTVANACPVLGSESQSDPAAVQVPDPRAVLSLDFRGDDFLGPPALLATPEAWPSRVIVMTLARVGAEAGPDVARVREVIGRADGRAVYAAGGVRHADDLRLLRDLGAAGALVATALHSGRLTAAEIDALGP